MQKSNSKADPKWQKQLAFKTALLTQKSVCWIRRVRGANFVRGAN
jgi:hypothetical protein